MKTLSVTAARQNLGAWLKRTLRGEDIGVVVDGQVVAFRPVKVFSEDYAEHEYGTTGERLDELSQHINRELDADLKARRMRRFTGKLRRA